LRERGEGFDREESTKKMRTRDKRITKVHKKVFPISHDP
jgi:hypothetical protein